jgi:hypothetical protein
VIWNGCRWRLARRGEIRVVVDGEVVSNCEGSSLGEEETVHCARAARVGGPMRAVVGAGGGRAGGRVEREREEWRVVRVWRRKGREARRGAGDTGA